MAILKRRMMREKKPAEAGASAPPASADPPFSEVLPSADGQVSSAPNPPLSEVSTLADETVSTAPAPPLGEPAEDYQNTQQQAVVANSGFISRILSALRGLSEKGPFIFLNRLSLLQKILLIVVSLSAAFLSYSLVASLKGSVPQGRETRDDVNHTMEQPAESSVAQTEASAVPAQRSSMSETGSRAEPLSLQLADGHYAAKDYVRAYSAYEQLHKNLTGQDFELVRDFLQFRMALCLEQKGYFDKANQIYKTISETRSLVLRALANYHNSLLEMNAGQYLKARTMAYKTIALTGALSPTCDWALDLERDCAFLAAEAVTRQVLSLCDADKELPQQLWSRPEQKDPLKGLNETELLAVLNSGIERLNSGLLAPQVTISPFAGSNPQNKSSDKLPSAALGTGTEGLPNRWQVVCNGPGIEELMSRFAANAALDVRWIRRTDEAIKNQRSDKLDSPGEAVGQTTGWNRPVTLYLPAATAQQVTVTAAGAVGLLATLDTETITITNPQEYSTLSEHTRELSENAMWLWRTLLLMYGDDARIPNVHFALGVLQESRNQLAEAITEYKLVANRYSQTAMSPFALLRCSRLKTTLRDYSGASRDLKQLIEQYPDNVLVGEAHLNLAETTMKAGLYDEACSLYRKAYNLGFSIESQTVAAFGAGKAYYQMKDYESAIKWLTRYFDALRKQQPAGTATKPGLASGESQGGPEPQNSADLYTSYLLLGKANLALGNFEAACDALNRTVRSASASDEYVEAVSALVETQIRQKNFVSALGTIENIRAWPFSQEQVTRLLLLKSNILREMGLTDQAITVLTDKAPYLTDSRLKAGIMLELARCYVAAQNLDLARTHLTEALSLVEPGPEAQQAQLELAEICLKLGDHRQTILICTQLLDSSACVETKQQATKILASAYSRQQNYDKAAMTLMTASVLPDETKLNTGSDK